MPNYITVSLTFPDELFPDLDTKKVSKQVREWAKTNCTQAIISEEHGSENGRYHHQGLIVWGSGVYRLSNVARSLRSALGISQSKWNTLDDPAIKRRMLVLKTVTYLTGAVGYVTKEDRGSVCNFGFEHTWLDEQAKEAEIQHQIRTAGKKIHINDNKFMKEVKQYQIQNDLPNDLKEIMFKMVTQGGYSFDRCRNLKCHFAEWAACEHKDKMKYFAYLSQFEPIGY